MRISDWSSDVCSSDLFELVAQRGQSFTLLFVVLDDAVVHQRHAVADVRMRVEFRHATMRGPAGVADAQVGMEALGAGGRLHFGDAAGTAHATDVAPLPLVDHGDAGRVVAAVFEALETFDEDGNHIAIRDRADDAAHGWGTPSWDGRL